jgi:hypothetical protein
LNYDLTFFKLKRIYGSYENLDAGQTFDALVDMSGNIKIFLNEVGLLALIFFLH